MERKGRVKKGKEVEGRKERREGVGRGRTPHFVNPGSAPGSLRLL